MYKLLFLTILLTLNIIASEVVATVNGKNITRRDIDRFLSKSIPGAKYSFMNRKQQEKVVEQLIERELYIDLAKKTDIQNSPEFYRELERVKDNLMLDIWMKRRLNSIRVTDSEARRYYIEHDSKFHRSAMAHARHILISTRDEAREIIKDLERTSNVERRFIQLAKEKSTGPSSKNGGDLGWFAKDQMLKEFSDRAFALRQGAFTHTPVHTPFGWHVIYLIEKKPEGKIEFSKVKNSIINSIKLKKFQKDLKKLSKKLKKSAQISVK